MGKKAGILSIGAGLGAMGVVVYHLVETMPNLDAASARTRNANTLEVSDLEHAVWLDYLETAWMQVYLTWGIAAVALILGVIAVVKGRQAGGQGVKAGVLGIVLAIVASVLPYVAGVGVGKVG